MNTLRIEDPLTSGDHTSRRSNKTFWYKPPKPKPKPKDYRRREIEKVLTQQRELALQLTALINDFYEERAEFLTSIYDEAHDHWYSNV